MAKLEPIATLDFETEPIAAWPDYPPKPVGVSIKLPGERKSKYLAWGHPTGNNCTRQDGERAVRAVWASRNRVLFHHGKFDQAVAIKHMGLTVLPWERYEDSMLMLFLVDPHSPNLKLKPSAHRLLGMAPEEQDAIREWAIKNKLMPRTAKEAGHLICKAPGDLVGRYANGDVMRTEGLAKLLRPQLAQRGLMEAYDRERRLLPILLRNEFEGVEFDVAEAERDALAYGGTDGAGGAMGKCDGWLRKRLKAPSLNIDSDKELAAALIGSGAAQEELFLMTNPSKTHPHGQLSTAKDSLIGAVTDSKVLGVLQYRARLVTAYGTFLMPWLTEAQRSGGRVHPSWNQVRQSGSSGDAGARTGRLSASRFMNVPKEFKQEKGKFEHPSFIAGLPELPFMRRYLKPDKAQVWCKRDYMQQELRVLGHFEDGALLDAFWEDAALDVHQLASDLIRQQFGLEVSRDDTKTIGFGLLYGMGLGSLAERLGVDVRTAKIVKSAYLSIFPGLKTVQDQLTARGKSGLPLTTWGGRQYYVEEPKIIEGRLRTFEYKLLNYLIQGSSADCTKEAIIRYDGVRRDGRFLVTVHDEIDLSVPRKAVKSEMALLREVMASVEFDVPMLSDGATGGNWGALEKFKEPQPVLRMAA